MLTTRSNSEASSLAPRRSGTVLRILVITMVLLTAGGAVGWYVLANSSFSVSADKSGPVFHTVERGHFIHDITERGNVESASNVEIKCEVQNQTGQGTQILKVIDEGAQVEEGDWLVTLDSSQLEDSKVKQQITCNSSDAAVIQAQSNFDTSEIARKEYTEGTFKENKLSMENKIFSAKEALRQAEQNLEYSKRLLAKGYVTKLEVEAHEYGVKKAEKDLDARETELFGLEEYTFNKRVTGLDADIETYKARLESEEHSHKLDLEKLDLITEQIAACTVKAPEPGQVVYANISNRRGGSETIIEEGAFVRERQTIIRLPDPARMQVKAKINEARVALVRQGMAATVELDAFTDQILSGEVEKVNEYPIPTSWYSGSIKEYETIIQITGKELPDGLRPGLTAEIKIRVEQIPDVLLVPVQAVFEHRGKHYCVLEGKKEGRWEAREVTTGSTNDKFVVIEEQKEGEDKGLREGEKVVLGALVYRDELDLPEVDPEQPKDQGEGGPGSGNQKEAAKRRDAGQARQPDAKSKGGKAGAKPGGKSPNPSQLFTSLDANGDGKLEKSELPSALRGHFARVDRNKDGFVDKSEFAPAAAAMKSMGGGKKQGADPGRSGNAASGGSP